MLTALLLVTLTVPASWLAALATLSAAVGVYLWLSAKDANISGYGFPAFGCAGMVAVLVVALFWCGWFLRGWLR